MAKARNARVRELLGPHRLANLETRSDGPGLRFFTAHLALSLASGALLWLSLDTPWWLPAAVLHGIVLVHWFAPCHECMHGTAFATPWLNTAVGWLAGLVIQLVPPYFKYEHLAHHAYTADPERDPERIPQGETLAGLLYYASAIPYFKGLLGALLRLPLGRFSAEERRFIPPAKRAGVRRAAQLMWLAYALIAAVSWWAQSWAAVTLWLLPRVLGEPFMRLIRMSEHVGCEQVADMLRNTRSVRTNRALRWLAWNMSLHAEHHALPQVPFHALPRLHGLLGTRLAHLSHGYPQAQLTLLRHAVNNARSGA